ncbi:MAG: hypothetical protein A3G13_02065, partial [Candidatus Levybacteria bacterium RIFCSPLOWO2_12_FULL_37_7]
TNKKISITLPAYNEEQTIEQVARNALHAVLGLTRKYQILLVNDGSYDKTGEIMNRIKKEFGSNISVVHHKKNKGFTGAMKSCYENANGDLIFLGPADGQFDYLELTLFIEAIKDNDIVVAYRAVNQEGFIRKFYSFLFHLITKLLFGIRLREFSSCILYTREVRNSISITSDPFSCLFLPEFIYRSMKKGYRIGEVPIHFYKRKGGVRKGTNFRMIVKTLFEITKFWFDIRLRRVR